MTYKKACQILGFSHKSLEANAKLAKSRLSTMSASCPLRFSVACVVLIEAAK